MDMLCHIFPLTSPWLHTIGSGHDSQTTEEKSLDEMIQLARQHSQHLLLLGHEKVNVTSLLFQGAVSCGTKDYTVVFVCPQPLTKIPLGVHGMPKPEANVLQHVQFQYMKSMEELVVYCASIHTRSVLPDVLMVDQLDHYLGQEKKGEHGLAKICALLLDTVTFIGTKSERGVCQLVIGCQHSQEVHPHILEKFSLTAAQIHTEDTTDTIVHKLSAKLGSVETSIEYKVAEGGIFLQDIDLTHR